MTKRRLLLSLLLLLFLAAPGLSAAEDEAAPEDPKGRFWEARKILLKGDPKSAAELFRTVAAKHPTSEVADDCYYWMGRCHLRLKDHEAEAAVAFLHLVKEYPESPFIDDAARELGRLGYRGAVPVLAKRLEGDGKAAEMAARALVELGEESGIRWITEHLGKDAAAAAQPREEKAAESPKASTGDELRKLKEELRRLKKEVEESVALLKKLLAARAAEKAASATGGEK